MAIRLVQARLWEGGECPARINTNVDDPLKMVRGTETRRNRLVACVVLLFTALWFPLCFRKGHRGTSVDWTSLNLSVHLTITEETLLPFELGCHPRSPALALLEIVFWVKQFVVAIKWVGAFLNGVQWNMVRTFALASYSGIWAVRTKGLLVVDGKLVSWFATKFDEVDEKAVGIQLSNSDSQQVAEALAILVGVRAWLSIWLEGLPIFEVKSDSVAALTMVARMHTRSPQVAVVAKELALTFSESCVRTR